MTLELYFHPLSSYCQKALVALYENETPFEGRKVDLSNPAERDALARLWPIAKFPVLHDRGRDQIVPEASIVIEYLALHYPGPSKLVPADPDRARQTRLRDRFYDLYVNDQVGKIVTDKFRPEGQHDVIGVDAAKARIREAYAMIDQELADKAWAMGDTFTMADCAAAPALFYANILIPIEAHKNAAAYLGRLMERPSFARAVREAKPYLALMPR